MGGLAYRKHSYHDCGDRDDFRMCRDEHEQMRETAG